MRRQRNHIVTKMTHYSIEPLKKKKTMKTQNTMNRGIKENSLQQSKQESERNQSPDHKKDSIKIEKEIEENQQTTKSYIIPPKFTN